MGDFLLILAVNGKKVETGIGSAGRYASIYDYVSEDTEDSNIKNLHVGFVTDKESSIAKIVQNFK